MNTGTIAASLFALALFVLMMIYEFSWRMKIKRGILTEGEVIGIYSDEDGGPYAIITYFFNDVRYEFHATFVLYNDSIGSRVYVLHDPVTHNASQYSFRHRWFLTIFLSVLVILLSCLAIVSK